MLQKVYNQNKIIRDGDPSPFSFISSFVMPVYRKESLGLPCSGVTCRHRSWTPLYRFKYYINLHIWEVYFTPSTSLMETKHWSPTISLTSRSIVGLLIAIVLQPCGRKRARVTLEKHKPQSLVGHTISLAVIWILALWTPGYSKCFAHHQSL